MGLRRILNCHEVPMNIGQFCPNWFEPTVGWFSFTSLTVRPCERGCFKYVLVYPGKMTNNLANEPFIHPYDFSFCSAIFHQKQGKTNSGGSLWLIFFWHLDGSVHISSGFFLPDSAVIKRHTAHGDGFFPLPPSTRNKSVFRSSQLMEFPWVLRGKTPRLVNCTIPLGS